MYMKWKNKVIRTGPKFETPYTHDVYNNYNKCKHAIFFIRSKIFFVAQPVFTPLEDDPNVPR